MMFFSEKIILTFRFWRVAGILKNNWYTQFRKHIRASLTQAVWACVLSMVISESSHYAIAKEGQPM